MVKPEEHERTQPPVEVERKFLVKVMPENFHHNDSTWIRQGYVEINADGSERRIRDRDGVYTETYKSGGGLVRTEIESTISAEEFDALWPATEGQRVEKSRFTIPHDTVTIELDVYDGGLWGLVIAEVEFPDEASAEAYQQPDWFGDEVTGIKAYKNQQLALHGMPQ